MVKDSMYLLELLRKRGVDGNVDFLREALRVLFEGIMDAEGSQLGSALVMVNAVPIGSPIATGAAPVHGTPG